MGRKKNKRNILPLKFIIFILLSVIGTIIYLVYPNDLKKIQKNKTFEEKLEYNSNKSFSNDYTEEIIYNKVPSEVKKQPENFAAETVSVKPEVKKISLNYKQDNNFKKLLDELNANPLISSSPEIIVYKLMKYKGYDPALIEIQYYANNETKGGSFIAGYFNYPSGTFNINKEALEKVSRREVIAIIAHELDHFDKIAQICKFMGIENFEKLLNKYNAKNINKEFWINAQEQADITSFNGKYYQEALERYLNQNRLELFSIYADIYKIAEMLRNPLEISAYELSDYILNYYNVLKEEGTLKKLVKEFNKFDWTIYNLSRKNIELNSDRTALFDYYIQETLKNNDKYKEIIDNCKNNKDGDLTDLWTNIRKEYNNFEQTNQNQYEELTKILSDAGKIAEQGLNEKVITDALKYKYYTQKTNNKYINSLNQIKKAAENYLKYMKENKIECPKDELDLIITLIKIENLQLMKSKDSLFYIKIPALIEELYGKTSKHQRFNFIYKNEEFKKKMAKTKLTEQQFLEELLKNTNL